MEAIGDNVHSRLVLIPLSIFLAKLPFEDYCAWLNKLSLCPSFSQCCQCFFLYAASKLIFFYLDFEIKKTTLVLVTVFYYKFF